MNNQGLETKQIANQPTILVTNLETLVWLSPSPMLIWVLQSSQCSKICMAQHWGRRGAHLSENEGVRSECKKSGETSRQMAPVSRFVMSIVFSWKTGNNDRFRSRWIFWDRWWKIRVFFRVHKVKLKRKTVCWIIFLIIMTEWQIEVRHLKYICNIGRFSISFVSQS